MDIFESCHKKKKNGGKSMNYCLRGLHTCLLLLPHPAKITPNTRTALHLPTASVTINFNGDLVFFQQRDPITYKESYRGLEGED